MMRCTCTVTSGVPGCPVRKSDVAQRSQTADDAGGGFADVEDAAELGVCGCWGGEEEGWNHAVGDECYCPCLLWS